MNSVVVHEGESLLGEGRIAVVVTGLDLPSRNRKTGPIAQAYIICSDMNPVDAVRSGHDDVICGDCVYRESDGQSRRCYVSYWNAPTKLFFSLDRIPRCNTVLAAGWLADKMIRLGAYGDPAAVPVSVWSELLGQARAWIGYTQQWRVCDQELKRFCMASVPDAEAAREAQALGWRTYRVRPSTADALRDGEIVCPASEEAGHRVTCERCKLCAGTSRMAANIVIAAHGQPRMIRAFSLKESKGVRP